MLIINSLNKYKRKIITAGNIQLNRQVIGFQKLAEDLAAPRFNQRFHLDIESGVIALSKKVRGFYASIGSKLMGSNLGPTNEQRQTNMKALSGVLQRNEPALGVVEKIPS